MNVYEAKTHLSALLDRVASGEQIVVAKAGGPVARLVPLSHPEQPRHPRAWRGRVSIAPDFDDPLPEELAAAFRGEGS